MLRLAALADLLVLAPLFDDYRQFYHYPADLELATRFLGERLGRDESTIFLAVDETTGEAMAITQLYRPSVPPRLRHCSCCTICMWCRRGGDAASAGA